MNGSTTNIAKNKTAVISLPEITSSSDDTKELDHRNEVTYDITYELTCQVTYEVTYEVIGEVVRKMAKK